MPSDHYIEDNEKFLKTLENAIDLASKDFLVTIGAKAIEPNSNYGYIIPASKKKLKNSFEIERFIEKPSVGIAKKVIQNHGLWNTGIIVIKNKVLTKLFKKYNKTLYNKAIASCKNSKLEKEFHILDKSSLKSIKEISMDYAILEKNFTKLVIPYKGRWSDLGTYDSLYKVKNSYGNIISIDSKNNFTYSDEKLLVVAGIDDQVVVNTKNI